jgi:hypothetical protein
MQRTPTKLPLVALRRQSSGPLSLSGFSNNAHHNRDRSSDTEAKQRPSCAPPLILVEFVVATITDRQKGKNQVARREGGVPNWVPLL